MLMRLLSVLLFFNKNFMTTVTTTLYPRVYVPAAWTNYSSLVKCEILAHEYVHLKDRENFKLLFEYAYLFPQILSLLSIGAFWNFSFIWFSLFLLPFPAPGRAWLEFRGYRMSMAAYYWLTGKTYNVDFMGEIFAGPSYYFMFPFRALVNRWSREELNKIKNYDILSKELWEINDVFRNV